MKLKKQVQITIREDQLESIKKTKLSVSSFIEVAIEDRLSLVPKLNKLIKFIHEGLPLLGTKQKTHEWQIGDK